MYRKIVFFILITLYLASCSKSDISNSNNNKENEVIDVGIYTYFYPFGYMEKGEIAGFDYDIMNKIADISGLKLKFHGMKFNDLLNSLEAGKIDVIIAAMTVTEARKKTMDFSTVYYTSKQVILTKTNNNDIQNITNLIGKNVGVVKNTTGNMIVSNLRGANMKVFDVGGGAVLALEVDKIDAFIFDKDPCLNYMRYSDDMKIIEIENSANENYAIAVRKGDSELLEKINYGLSNIMGSGVYEELIDKNFK